MVRGTTMERGHVEMAGVEPASEEKTTRITPYIVCLVSFAPPHPTDRTQAAQPRVAPHRPAAECSPFDPGGGNRLSRLDSASSRDRAGATPGDGPLNYLSSQCVVVRTYGFPLYYRATRRARYAILTIFLPVEATSSPHSQSRKSPGKMQPRRQRLPRSSAER